LKWAGGKSQALPALRQFLEPHSEKGTYYEPFLGGGAVFFSLAPPSAVLSDLNKALVYTYQAVKDNVDGLIRALGRLPLPETEKDYYSARNKFNQLVAHEATLDKDQLVTFSAMFIWLNHLCYNGLYRVNKKGGFNVPYGFYQKPSVYNSDVLRAASRALKGTRIMACDYETAVETAGKGDLVYFDPPYDPKSETAKFTAYTASGFDSDEQARLSRVVHELVDRGCHVVVSNSPSERILDLYRGFRIERVPVTRAINCVGSRREAVDELIIIA
jgi:DNA adenine methylase